MIAAKISVAAVYDFRIENATSALIETPLEGKLFIVVEFRESGGAEKGQCRASLFQK